MDPLPRPEWASPIEVGIHARSFYSALPEHPTRAVLHALTADPKLLAFLAAHPLGRLEFSARMLNPAWRGSYDPPSRDVVVNPFRGPETFGKEFYPSELPTVSEAGRNLIEAMQRTLYHELGHAVLDTAGAEPYYQVRRLFRSGTGLKSFARSVLNWTKPIPPAGSISTFSNRWSPARSPRSARRILTSRCSVDTPGATAGMPG